jgi:erythromycin esterase
MHSSRRELLIGGAALASAPALGGEVHAAAGDKLAAHAHAIRTIEPEDDDYDDLEPFGDAVGDARIVQLGECSHGSGTDFKAKARLVRFLHARMGFDVLVWESGLHAMGQVNAGFRAGSDPVTAARRGVFGIWSGAAEVKPLFDYAKASQAGPRPLEMAGFDCQFTARGADQALAEDLRAFVRQVREPALRAAAKADVEAAIAAYAKVAGRTATEADLRASSAAIDRLLSAMERRRSAFEQVHAAREIGLMGRALESLRVFTQLTYDTIPGGPGAVAARFKDETGFFNRREAQNARNLRWLAEEVYPGRKLIVWAHNVHVINAAFAPGFSALRPAPRPGDMVPMGLSTARAFKGHVYTLGLTSYAGLDRWVNSKGTATPIPAPGPDTLEARLHALGRPYLFLNSADLDPVDRHGLGRRVFVPSPGSAPESPRGLFPGPDAVAAFDGVLFIDRAHPATPLQA